jgi:uncharacterized membrane protein YjjP (DUF1212 family)
MTTSPISRIELREITDICLQLGQLLLQNGASARRVEESVHLVGTTLGADWLDIFISANALVVTATSGEEFRTKSRRVVRFGGVNLGMLVRLSKLTHRVRDGLLDIPATRAELAEITTPVMVYPRWLVVGMVGLACGAFSQLFGGDWPTFVVTWLSASTAVFLRQTLTHQQLNPFLNVILTAFLATSLAGIGYVWGASTAPTIALAASVLLLVPGVPLINAVNDLFQEYMMVGIARGTTGILISLSIAAGLALAIGVWQMPAAWPPPFHPLPNLGLDVFWAALAAMGFATMFQVPRHTLWACVLVAAMGHGIRYMVQQSGVPGFSHIILASFVAAIAVGFVGLLLARQLHVPPLIFNVTGVIPMIPGTFAFGAMLGVLQLVNTVAWGTTLAPAELLVNTAVDAFNTALILAALGLGTIIPGLLLRRTSY